MAKKSFFDSFCPRPFIEEPKPRDLSVPAGNFWLGLLIPFIAIAGLLCHVASALLQPREIADWEVIVPITIWTIISSSYIVLRPKTASGFLVLSTFALIYFQCNAFLRLEYGQDYAAKSALSGTASGLSVLLFILQLNLPLRHPQVSRDGISKIFSRPSYRERSPEDAMTLWQWMSVTWVGPIITVGREGPLDRKDIWKLPYEFHHRHLHDVFSKLKGSIVARLLKANWHDFVILTCFVLFRVAVQYSVPLLLQQLLLSMRDIKFDKRPAMFWTLITFAAQALDIQRGVLEMWYSRRLYERSRGELICMVHEKTLRRKVLGGLKKDDEKVENEAEDEGMALLGDANSNKSVYNGVFASIRQYWMTFWTTVWPQKEEDEQDIAASKGKILNVMKDDSYNIAMRLRDFDTFIEVPLGLVLSITVTLRIIGWPALVGFAVTLLGTALDAGLAKTVVNQVAKRKKATDDKLQRVSQYAEAIRHLRYYAWSGKWLDGIMTARQKELALIVRVKIWYAAIQLVDLITSNFLKTVTFYTYTVFAGNKLTVDIAFPALQAFDLVEDSLWRVPNLYKDVLDGLVSLRRIQAFMDEPDKDEKEHDGIHFGDKHELRDATFAWPGMDSEPLQNVTLTITSGLNVVCGVVGSGKSALLLALLGELDLKSGDMTRPRTDVAYCAQTPWLQSMTVRDNILFGFPLDEKRYSQVLFACGLEHDLKLFKQGDRSPIGENGIGLSGGQKMRVALARAVYSPARHVLLDDPLSALDQSTAEHVVEHCLKGPLLSDRIVILVTHRVDICLKVANQVIQIKNKMAEVQDLSHASETLPESILSPTTPAKAIKAIDDVPKADAKTDEEKEKFEDDEFRADGEVELKLYWQYIKSGGVFWWVALFIAVAMTRVVLYLSTWYMKEWGEAYEESAAKFISSFYAQLAMLSTNPLRRLFDHLPNPNDDPLIWVYGVLALDMAFAVMYWITNLLTTLVEYRAGKQLFRRMMYALSETTFRFYDVTPVGRMMNRMTSDLATIDGGIAYNLFGFIWQTIGWSSTVLIVALITPLYTLTVVIVTVLFVYSFRLYIKPCQSLRRLETISLSPLMSDFGALLDGLTTVRAFAVQEQFQSGIIGTVDEFQRMDHFYWSMQAWIYFRFGAVTVLSNLAFRIISIYTGLSPGLTGFALNAANRFVIITQGLCHSYGYIQAQFVAVERVIEYVDLKGEDPGTVMPPASWPSTKDDIVFDDVTVKYAPEFDPALKNLSLTIPGGSSTAVIGRTGSGKSTLALTLLATLQPESGTITIGGIDLAKVDKHTLRSRITFLAQEPMLFPGTLRHNIDPLEEHSEQECAAVLDRVCGKFNFELDKKIDVGGKNLSQGQRQLVGLARAILRRSSIIIMDEATASIDGETSWEIQRVLKEELVGSTLVTIAHRPSAVRDADLCIKLANGGLEVMGKPQDIVMEGATSI